MDLLLSRSIKTFGKRGLYVSFSRFERRGMALLLGMRFYSYKALRQLLFFIFYFLSMFIIDDP